MIRAAQYLRMSTEHQQYSLVNQAAAIASYALAHDCEIVKTYVDEGRSGLVLKERLGLQELLRDVVSAKVPYKTVLVYDVSRWGRFQDTDEAAHYEFLCKSSGVPVCYCAETFENNNSLPNLIMKNLKRVMAGEYSRELSVKVYEGLKRIAQQGFSTGGVAGYGFRRMLVGADRKPKQLMAHGDRKGLQTDRVVLVHGPHEEIERVREIYRLAIEERLGPSVIAKSLNKLEVPFWNNREWYPQAVQRILTHPKYIGCQVYGRKCQKLHAGTTYVPRDKWLIVPGAHEAIVSQETYDKAQRALDQITRHKTNETLLQEMRDHLAHRNSRRVSLSSITTVPHLPSLGTYVRRFGSTRELCKLLGMNHDKEFARAACRVQRGAVRAELLKTLQAADPLNLSIVPATSRRKDFLKLRRRASVAVVGCSYFETKCGLPRWLVCPAESDKAKGRVYLLCLFNSDNTKYEHFYIVRKLRSRTQFTLREHDDYLKSGVSVTTLSGLYESVKKLNRSNTRSERLAPELRR